MTDVPTFAPESDDEARQFVRSLTGYEDTADELPTSDLQIHLDLAKLELHNETGAGDEIYDDAGLAQALVAGTAIKAKLAIENYSVDAWSIGDQEIQAGAFNNPEEAQLQNWHQMHLDGLRASDHTRAYSPSNASGYIG